MRFKATFKTTDQSFAADFGAVQNVSDGGYERGYEKGYNEGHTEGYESGYGKGNTDGYENGYGKGHTDGYDKGHTEGHDAGYSEGYDAGYGQVKEEQEKTIEITENGTTEVLPDDGKVLSKVTVNVEVASSGGNENFVGIKLSEFNYRKAPLVADMRSLPINGEFGGFPYLFANASPAGNGGFYAHLRDVYVPSGLTDFGSHMFSNCGSLKNIIGDCTSIENLHGSVFQNCISLTEVPYMPKLGYVDNNVFNGCTSLTEFKFYSKPHTLKAGSFINCSNLLDIFVPWEEGAVAYAPWGAPKATIHYNTIYDENHDPIVEEV